MFFPRTRRDCGSVFAVPASRLWNTVYLEWAVCALQRRDPSLDEALCRHLSPLGWEHINLAGDYVWK